MTPGSPEAWWALVLTIAVGLWPVMVALGMVWGRMQAHDAIVRAAFRADEIPLEDLFARLERGER